MKKIIGTLALLSLTVIGTEIPLAEQIKFVKNYAQSRDRRFLVLGVMHIDIFANYF